MKGSDGSNFTRRKLQKVSKDIFRSHNRGSAPDTWWVGQRNAIKLSTVCRMAALHPCPPNKEFCVPKCVCVGVEQLCSPPCYSQENLLCSVHVSQDWRFYSLLSGHLEEYVNGMCTLLPCGQGTWILEFCVLNMPRLPLCLRTGPRLAKFSCGTKTMWLGWGGWVECLPCMCEAQRSIPSTGENVTEIMFILSHKKCLNVCWRTVLTSAVKLRKLS